MKKWINQITIIFFAIFSLILFIWDVSGEKRRFSPNENKMLAQLPIFSIKSFVNKEFSSKYKEYLSDQFLLRDEWIRIKTYSDMTLGKKEIKGVYLGGKDTLLEVHMPQDITEEAKKKRLNLLKILVEDYSETLGAEQVRVMLVPTADNILKELLPKNAPFFDQKDFLEEVKETIGKEYVVNVFETLEEHKSEEIYYRTDHHWTTLGAYYGYEAWADSMSTVPVLQSAFHREIVSRDFWGALHSKINIAINPDYIEKYDLPYEQELQVIYDMGQEETDSLYGPEFLETKNQYGYFLKDNHPFLTSHYETICIVDLRYYKMSLYDLIDRNETTDILILYDVIHFINEFQYF